MSVLAKSPLADWESSPDRRRIQIIAGPCSMESKTQLWNESIDINLSLGLNWIRGGIFKMRSSPNSFQGIGMDASALIKESKEKHPQLSLISEITDTRQFEWMEDHIDAYQVGTRNMYNYELLKVLGSSKKPVLLKRAFSATIDEWMMASDYITQGGNNHVVLCERGIRSFDTKTRNTLDLSAVAYLKRYSQLPVFVDPSHATGLSELVEPMSLAALAAGADGLLLEVHPKPEEALSDARQTIDFKEFSSLVTKIKKISNALGRPVGIE